MRTSRSGQAAYEFALVVFLLALVLLMIVNSAPILTQGLDMLDTARTDAGVAALRGTQGSRTMGMAGVGRIAGPLQPGPVRTALATAPGTPPPPDPWDYPIRELPSESRFADWRAAQPRATSLVYGTAKDRFVLPTGLGPDGILEQEIHLSEEVFFPALGQPSNLQ